MATQGIEEVTENAIRAVARDCGSLSMEQRCHRLRPGVAASS